MFIVKTDLRNHYIEFDNVVSWNEIPRDEKIESVTLTDGGKVSYTLSGYDWYVCCYDAILRLKNDGNSVGVAKSSENQVLYGIRDSKSRGKQLGKIAQSIKRDFNNMFKTEEIPNAILYSTVKQFELEKLDKNFREAASKLANTEVAKITLGISIEHMSQEKCSQNKDCWREGMGSPQINLDVAQTMKELMKG